MKLTKIEKQMLAMVVVMIVCMFVFFYTLNLQITKMEQNGGLKAVVEKIWEGDKK